MTYLLDTNVVSELRKPPGRAHPGVLAWSQRQTVADLAISVITVFEIEHGILRVERRDPGQAALLREWLDQGVLAGFAGRIHPVDVTVSRRAASFHVPDPRPERDAFIAATAAVHGLVVITRDLAGFEPLGVATLDPWAA